jgi:hypothetical protein
VFALIEKAVAAAAIATVQADEDENNQREQ